MSFGFRAVVGLAMASLPIGPPAAQAGDDGQAPLWVGIGSIFGGLNILGGEKKEKDPIDYREHGKIVLPPSMDLPPPGSAPAAASDWPVNQETERKRVKKEAAKKEIAGVGDARLRYTHPFPPNTPVTVNPTDQDIPGCAKGGCDGGGGPSFLGNLNPLGWVGLGKSEVRLGPEPDREWLTDPPMGYRAPLEPTGQAAK
ncbi:MAG: hypothetical protein JO288_21155 [Hyphomicrobiales bacterium]|nr:hypothetical protein [Hyphomicrobiales bacterium]